MTKASSSDLHERFIHLGLGATAVEQPAFADISWYEAYDARHGADGPEGRLVSMYRFSQSWDMWEMHPAGAEVVVCTSGKMTLVQEQPDDGEWRITLTPGCYAINPPGTWHTADIAEEAEALFITAGQGTRHRPR